MSRHGQGGGVGQGLFQVALGLAPQFLLRHSEPSVSDGWNGSVYDVAASGTSICVMRVLN